MIGDADPHDLMRVKISGLAIMRDFNPRPVVSRWWLHGERARRPDTHPYGQRHQFSIILWVGEGRAVILTATFCYQVDSFCYLFLGQVASICCLQNMLISNTGLVLQTRSQSPGFESCWRQNSAHDGTILHCTEPFIIYHHLNMN